MVDYTQQEFLVRELFNHNQDYILTEIARLPKMRFWSIWILGTPCNIGGKVRGDLLAGGWEGTRHRCFLFPPKKLASNFPAREACLKWPMTQSSKWLCRPLLRLFRLRIVNPEIGDFFKKSSWKENNVNQSSLLNQHEIKSKSCSIVGNMGREETSWLCRTDLYQLPLYFNIWLTGQFIS